VIKGFAERYRSEAAKLGRKPFICLMRDAVIAENMEKAEAESVPTMVTHRFYFKYGAYVSDEYLKDVHRAEDLTFRAAARDRLIAGSPGDCLEQLLKWKQEIRPDYLIIRLRQPGGPPHERALEAIRIFGDSVISRL
jgi:alkanesulfonate monooxygenase SsuD/methylene tetrahydromethanopterin reductase-like flavin-dependent oxidoreductase (luciferase family)